VTEPTLIEVQSLTDVGLTFTIFVDAKMKVFTGIDELIAVPQHLRQAGGV
jgi:hypothetical protein